MKQQPDHIFRHKLNLYFKPTPPVVWDRVEKELDKKQKKSYLWLYAAASVSVTLMFGYFVAGRGDDGRIASSGIPSITSETSHPDLEKAETARAMDFRSPSAKTETREVKTSLEPTAAAVQKPATKAATPVAASEDNSVIEKDMHAQKPAEVTFTVDSARSHYTQPTQLAFRASEKNNVTIILTADQTQEYLITKSTSQATSEEKKPSTFKKLLQKAADLKVNQDPFGELRQKKNEILALNFRNDKQRGQKK